MRNLIKLLMLAIVFSFTSVTFAQSYVVKGGLNLSKIMMRNDEDTFNDQFDMTPGFHIGVTSEFPIFKEVAFETGLLLSTKGFKRSATVLYGGETKEFKGSANLLYLDIPITVKTYFNIRGTKFYGALGPYIGFGLSGKSKEDCIVNGVIESDEKDVNWGTGDSNDLKRLDFGLTAGAGMEINTVQIGLSYNFGLANISANTEIGQTINNRVLSLSVGYKFGGK